MVTNKEQSSPNNTYSLRKGEGKTGAVASASGFFSTAWITHGNAPNNGTYAYVIFPQVGVMDIPAFEKRVAEFPSFRILRQDDRAHIVEDTESGTVAYACFEGGTMGVGVLESVSVPCFAMVRKSAEGLGVSVANPDLNQKEDAVKGLFSGVSKAAPVTLKLAGSWKIKGTAKAWTEPVGDSTLLSVECVDGKSMEVELEQR